MKKILLLDDDESIREIFPLLLKKAGYEVSVLAHGEELVDQPFDEPDLFVIDKQLRGISGLDVCRFLKGRPVNSHTPVIIISASNKVQQTAMEAGADAFLEKPFKSALLMETIKNVLTV